MTDSIISRHFLIVFGSCLGFTGCFAIVNVYGPQSPADKAKLWMDLYQIKEEKDATWIFLGDFNAVRRRDERINSRFCQSSANAFNRFILDADLHDLRMGGCKFTYYQEVGAKLSKLYRFLVCSQFLNSFPLASSLALPRDLSDHSPIILKASNSDFGPPPFKFFNSWLLREDFIDIVSKACSDFKGYGAPDSMLRCKLKHIKNNIRRWRATKHSAELGELKELRKRLMDLDSKAENNLLLPSEISDRASVFTRIVELEKLSVLDMSSNFRFLI